MFRHRHNAEKVGSHPFMMSIQMGWLTATP